MTASVAWRDKLQGLLVISYFSGRCYETILRGENDMSNQVEIKQGKFLEEKQDEGNWSSPLAVDSLGAEVLEYTAEWYSLAALLLCESRTGNLFQNESQNSVLHRIIQRT